MKVKGIVTDDVAITVERNGENTMKITSKDVDLWGYPDDIRMNVGDTFTIMLHDIIQKPSKTLLRKMLELEVNDEL